MISSSNSTLQWGKLTSLNPDFDNISLSNHPSNLIVPREGLQDSIDENLSSKGKCQIYQKQGNFFISYTGNRFCLEVDEETLNEGDTFKIYSGAKIVIILKKMRMEYIFSGELIQKQKETLKRDRENHEEIDLLKKKNRFEKKLKKEMICGICEKMIYECTSVVPCLHRFCMHCLMKHLSGGQECPQCGETFFEFRKDTFFNNIIEAYDESGYERDRSEKRCQKISEKLERERVFARFGYANERIYEGEWRKCRKDGKGKMTFEDGCIYEGDWKNDRIEGKGKRTCKSGEIYEGDWKNGRRDGKGKMIYADGDVYEGDWKNNKMEGKGKMMYKNGNVYEGDWINDKKNGKGEMRYANGNVYEGSWKYDKKEGKGKMIWSNGTVYEGDWKNNKIEGKGKMIWSNGTVYEGDWKNNKRKGKGRLIFHDGHVYEGDWEENEKEGKGKMIFPNGDIYEGDWRNNKRTGKGKMLYHNGDIYVGDWKNHQREGKGKLVYKNYDVDVGDWESEKREVRGELFYNNEDVYVGDWKDDAPINILI